MIVRQIENVLELLEFFSKNPRPATLTEISDAFGWPRSSTYNLLTTLLNNGFLYEPRPKAGYYPSPRWLSLAQSFVDAEPLPPAAFEIISDLVKEHGETAAIGAAAGTNAIFVHVLETTAPVRFAAAVGHRLPIHATATGRAILAQYSRNERESMLKRVRFERYTPSSLVSVEEVEKEIARAVERGWHENPAGHSPDLFGVALSYPVGDRRLSIVVAGPHFRMENRAAQVAESIRKAIQRY